MRAARAVLALVLGAGLTLGGGALAQDMEHAVPHQKPGADRPGDPGARPKRPPPRRHQAARPRTRPPGGQARRAQHGHGAHGAAAAAAGAHAASAGHGEEHEQHFNWAHGFLGEKEGAPPSLLYRPKGTPPPFLANVLNAAILFGILYHFGRKPVADALKKRRERVVAGMQEAAKMREEAAQQLAHYEEKLQRIDDEIERIRREMRESAEAERKRILHEAKERRERMERDAKLLVEQELKAAHEALMRETVEGALRSAADLLSKQIGPADQERISREHLDTLRQAGVLSQGGRA